MNQQHEHRAATHPAPTGRAQRIARRRITTPRLPMSAIGELERAEAIAVETAGEQDGQPVSLAAALDELIESVPTRRPMRRAMRRCA